MKMARRCGGLVMVATLAVMVPAGAEAQQFFGEDLHNSADTRIPAKPNADAARTAFLSHLSGVGTESFEDFAANTFAPIDLVFPGAGTATLTGSGAVRTQAAGTNGFGRYPTHGNNFYEVNTGSAFSIVFSAPVAAFGFFGIDIGDFGEQLFLNFSQLSGGNTMVAVPHTLGVGGSTDGSVLFYGLIDTSDPFTSVAFTSSVGEVFAFDEMTIGSVQQVVDPTVVPEPISMVLLGTGLAGVAAARRRRRERDDIA
jgi:hypothetical protein